jgi:low temperature requirement protein LtrA
VLLAPGVLAAPVLIVIAGFLDAGLVRGTLWTLAIVATIGAPFVSGTQGWYGRPGHFAERHALIVIIALGESLVALGVSASEEPKTFTVVCASVMGLALVACLWWIYFDVVSRAAELALRRASGAARNALARDVYSYVHFLMVLGVVFVALGLKKGLLDVRGPLDVIASVGLFGGVALYLQGQLEEALTEFLQSTVIDESFVDGFIALGALHRRLGDAEAAQAALERTASGSTANSSTCVCVTSGT